MTFAQTVLKGVSELMARRVFKIVSNGTIRKFFCFTLFSLVFAVFFFGQGMRIAAQSNKDQNATIEINPFQSIYPPIAKIIGEGETEKSDSEQIQAIFYGSGIYVAEVGDFGIVLTNWHVVSEAKRGLLVRFSQFETPGTVIMADAVWDIAAIVIYRPPFLPFPISLEVPQVGDELWVAGFGQHPDLGGYQISSGPVLGYGRPNEDGNQVKLSDVSKGLQKRGPDAQSTLPCETIQIGTGIRYGDSGGPILNQYGELAGILWGSDGHLAMGTFCLRLQAFLTQAQFQLMNYRFSAPEFFARASRNEIPLKKISMPSIPAQNALRSSGIYPISSQPIYLASKNNRRVQNLPPFYKPAVTTDIEGVRSASPLKEFKIIQTNYRNAHRNGFTLPPYPANPSPTLAAQQKAIGRDHPEIYVEGRFAAKALTPNRRQKVDVQPTAATDVALSPSGANDGGANFQKSSTFQNAGLENESSTLPSESVQNVAEEETVEEETTEGDEKKEEGGWIKKVPGFPNISLSHLQSIVAMVIVLFLFINALRLLVIASERSGRSK